MKQSRKVGNSTFRLRVRRNSNILLYVVIDEDPEKRFDPPFNSFEDKACGTLVPPAQLILPQEETLPAIIALLVEHWTGNQHVRGSNPGHSSFSQALLFELYNVLTLVMYHSFMF
ncbi:hypothetical protein AVEN_146428-1 [Araneus ventricosus]|uniref:Uncharacterized protein n=1 Tax=Araneus ventricosus TaxID=182803 RepID=A0A4Y2NJB3_ARAVE|nr:hypothetical protein AVEN_146428-1 [Araneus ventricosus]